MTDFEWFVKVIDWEFNHLEEIHNFEIGVWQQIFCMLLGYVEAPK